MIEFDAPKEMSSMIKVIGVGGGGSNAVNHMFLQGIKGVDFIICNTDSQALDSSPIPNKIQLGSQLTGGRGAGAIPEVGKNAAMENLDELRDILSVNTEMLFITAGMGGGTGTGAAPIIAAMAKEMGILTVGIVTIPFKFEGRKRRLQAEAGIEELRNNVDTLLIISNDKLRELHGNLTLTQAFGKADNILTDAARGIAEIITVTGYVNVDIEDVKTVMRNSGVAIMGTGIAEGEDRALQAVELALSSPLLNDNNIHGASNILLFMASGSKEIEMDEVASITDYIQEEAGLTAEIIWGNGFEEELADAIRVTVVATGFSGNSDVENMAKPAAARETKVVVHKLEEEDEKEVIKNRPIVLETPEDDGMRLITRNPEIKQIVEPQAPVYQQSSPENTFQNIQNQNPSTIERPVEKTEPIPMVAERTPRIEPAKVTIYSLDSDNTEVINKSEHDSIRRIIEESLPEINTDFQNKANERISRLRNLSSRFLAHEDLAELENTPAYIRRGVSLPETPSSKEQVVSRYTLDAETGDIRSNNTYLHDNVD
jgi:cell division protein FtsZ